MRFTSWTFSLFLLVACNPGVEDSVGDTGVPDETPLEEVASGSPVGPAGAIVTGGEGAEEVRLEVPPGALTEDVAITIEVVSEGYAATPAVAGSPVVAFEPHGLTFAVPVTISLPHTLTPGDAVMWTAQPGGDWEKLASVDLGTRTEVAVTHFSFFFNGREVCGLHRQECCEAPDDACAGHLLECVALTSTGPSVCLPCGLPGEPCCGGDTCLFEETCPDGMTGDGVATCGDDGQCASGCQYQDTADTGGGGGDTGR